MGNVAKSLFLALTAFAVAGLFVFSSPAKPAHAQSILDIEKICIDDATGPFTLVVDLEVVADIEVNGTISGGVTDVTLTAETADISDLLHGALDAAVPLVLEIECTGLLSDVLPDLGEVSLTVADLVDLLGLDLGPLGLDPAELTALQALELVLFGGGTLLGLDQALDTGIDIDECVLIDICVDLTVTGDLSANATITEPGGSPTFGGNCTDGIISFDFEEESTVVCVITNATDQVLPELTLTVEKSCEGAAPPAGPFAVTIDGGEAQAIICGGSISETVPLGTSVTITETDVAGAAFTAIDCGAGGFAEDTSITVTLVDDLTCTIINSSDEITPPDDDDDDDGAGGGVDVDNNNTNVIVIDNTNTNTNANNNNNENENENTNINENNNTNTNTQNQENHQDQNNTNNQTNNIDTSPVINIKF